MAECCFMDFSCPENAVNGLPQHSIRTQFGTRFKSFAVKRAVYILCALMCPLSFLKSGFALEVLCSEEVFCKMSNSLVLVFGAAKIDW